MKSLIIYICIIAGPFAVINSNAQEQIPVHKITERYIDSLIRLADTGEKYQQQQLLHQAITASNKTGYTKGLSHAYLNMGSIYMSRAQYDSALYSFSMGIMPDTAINDTETYIYKAMLQCGIAGAFMFSSETDSAAHYAYQSLNTLQQQNLNTSPKAVVIYNNIAGLWLYMADEKQSLTYLKKALKLSLGSDNKRVLAYVYLNLAGHYMNTGNTDSARYYLNRVRDMGQDREFVPAMLSLARFHLNQRKDPDKAIMLLKRLLDLTKNDHKDHRMNVCYRLGLAYRATGKPTLAETSLLHGLALQDTLGALRHVPDFYGALADLYYHTGQFQKAYQYREQSIEAHKSIWTREKQEYINELEARYNSVQKDKQLAEHSLLVMTQQNDIRHKNFWIASLSAAAVLISIVFGLIYRNNRHKQKLQAAAIKALKKEQQITRLQSVMEGELKERKRIAREIHDGVSSMIGSARMHLDLRSGKESIDENAYRQGISLLEDAYRELRHISHNLVPEQLLEKGLIPALRSYCLKVSRPGIFEVTFQHSGNLPDLPPATSLSLFRIVQELLHNAHRHGHANHVLIDSSVTNQELMVTIEDNGRGLPPDYESQSGTGLKHLRERAQVIHCQIEIYNRKEKGTTFYLSVPFHAITAEQHD